MRGFLDWWENWAQLRAEKNRRFKIPCHLGVTRTGLSGTTEDQVEESSTASTRHLDVLQPEGQHPSVSKTPKTADRQNE